MAPPLLPITRLVACPACAQHVKSSEAVCPHCGVALRGPEGRVGRAAAAVLMGLALSSCGDKDPDTASDSESGTGTSSTSSTGDTGSSSTGDGSGSGTESTTSMPEPEYGVPVTTGSSAEPDYGVPATETAAPTEASTGDTDTDASTGDTDATTGGSGNEPLYGAGAL